MAKNTDTPPVKDESKQIAKDLKQFSDWKMDLQRYWPEMDKWQEMYEFYKSKAERSETDSNISLNTPFAIVESQIAKENQATLQITVQGKPDNNIGKFDLWVGAILKDAIEDPEVAEIYGTFRKTKEMWSRALKVVGNAVGEINYCYKTEIIDGKKKVIADNPYTKTRSYKSVIFNPAMTLASSDIYYVEDYVSMDDLKGQEQKTETDAKGKVVSSHGLYTNLGELAIKLNNAGGQKDLSEDTEITYISGDTKINRKNKPIRTITKWQGTKMTVYAAVSNVDGVKIREEIDPLKLGGHNLVFGMRYQVEGRPYAYGEIAAIYKPVRAQDTIVAQGIEIVERYLRGSYILGSDIDIDEFMLVLANGGAMAGDVKSIANIPVNTPPPGAFQSIDVLQQAIERAARFSLYGAGISAQSTDKTKGTASGIASIQQAAEPNTEIQMDDIEDMFMEPVARKYLKMIGRLMGVDEVRYGLLQGQNKEWVKATKGILTGEWTLQDMVTVGLLTQDQFTQYTTTQKPVIDPQTGQPAVDPQTGQPQMQQIPIPGAEDAVVTSVDWVVKAQLDNQSQSLRMQKIDDDMRTITFVQGMGAHFSPQRTLEYIAVRKDRDGLTDLLMNQQEIEEWVKMQQSMPKIRVNETGVDYDKAPEDVKRQIEQQEGYQPSQIPPGAPGSNVQPSLTPAQPQQSNPAQNAPGGQQMAPQVAQQPPMMR